MMIEGGGVPAWIAFIAGAISFASACVLPIVPAFGVLVAGLTAAGPEEAGKGRSLTSSVKFAALFLVGFGLLFVLSGSTATGVGSWVRGSLQLFEVIGAIAVGVFGVLLVGRRLFHPRMKRGGRELVSAAVITGSVLAGAGFAAAWTPCIGPVLAEILLYATFPETLGEGILLLTLYTLGLATPFLLIGLAVGWLTGRLLMSGRWNVWMERGLGIVLIVFSVLLLTGRFAFFTAYLSGFGPMIDVGL